MEKKWNFRTLKSDDMFVMFGILGKIGINQFKKLFESEDVKKLIHTMRSGKVDGDESYQETASLSIVMDVVQIICININRAKDDIYRLFADTSNLSVEEIKELSMTEMIEMIGDFVRKDEFPDFIKAVSRLFNTMM